MALHATLPDSQLHEPKGVASATAGKVYVADGSGSGTWQVLTHTSAPVYSVVNRSYAETATYSSTTSAIPYDDTIPQNTEGTELLTVSHTPLDADNKLIIKAQIQLFPTSAKAAAAALFKDSDASAIAAASMMLYQNPDYLNVPLVFQHTRTAGTTSAVTFKVRVGTLLGGTVYINGTDTGRKFGGVITSFIEVLEYKA